MLSRRQLLAAGAALAAGTVGLKSAEAHKAGEKYVLPEKYMPRVVSMRQRFEPGTIDVFPDQYWLSCILAAAKRCVTASASGAVTCIIRAPSLSAPKKSGRSGHRRPT